MSTVLAEADSHGLWLEPLFDVAFSAPGGMARLRQLILTLAMQGKLVPQDPKDTPVSESLKQIASERAGLVKAGKIRKIKGNSPVADSEKPYAIPGSWKWTRLGDICRDWGQKTPDKMFTYIDVGGIDNIRGEISNDVQVLEPAAAPSRARKLVKAGTVIYSTVRPYLLNVAIVEQDYKPEAIASTAFAVLHPHAFVSSRFVYHYLRSPSFVRYVESTQKGVAYPAISDGEFFAGVFPLPPFEEQNRIIVRIDELLSRCDELEFQRNVQETKRHEARAAAVREWLAGDDSAAVLLGEHFATLLSTREDVAELRKAVLELAVMGKLVAHASPIPNEPLKELASKIGSGSTPSGGKEAYQKSGIPLIRSMNVHFDGFKHDGLAFINDAQAAKLNNVIVQAGDVLLNITGASIGRVTIAPGEMSGARVNQHVCIIRSTEKVDARYLWACLASPFTQERIFDVQVGATREALTKSMIEKFQIPLPPLPEQKRIIARIDELMRLCDTLEGLVKKAEGKQVELLDAVMARVH